MAFPRLHSSDINRIQDGLQKALRTIGGSGGSPIPGTSLLKDVEVSTSGSDIPHNLGHKWSGYIVVKQDGPATIYDEESSDDGSYLRLVSSSTISVSLLVF